MRTNRSGRVLAGIVVLIALIASWIFVACSPCVDQPEEKRYSLYAGRYEELSYPYTRPVLYDRYKNEMWRLEFEYSLGRPLKVTPIPTWLKEEDRGVETSTEPRIFPLLMGTIELTLNWEDKQHYLVYNVQMRDKFFSGERWSFLVDPSSQGIIVRHPD